MNEESMSPPHPSPHPFRIHTKLMGKGLRVSTVDLLVEKPKLIASGGCCFETAVFHKDTGGKMWDFKRYDTKKEARQGHREMVAKWKAKSRGDIRWELGLLLPQPVEEIKNGEKLKGDAFSVRNPQMGSRSSK